MKFLNTLALKPLNKKKPKKIIILFHGYGGNGKNIALLANFWRKKLKDVIFYCPDAPFKCKNDIQKFQWFSPNTKDSKILKSEISLSVEKINKFIDKVLKLNNLKENDIVIGGFSQGCMLALEAGIRRKIKIKAIIGYSGKILNIKELRNNIMSKPNIYLFHGKNDDVVLPKFFFSTKKFLLNNKFNLISKLFKNCEHKIPAYGANLGLDFLKKEIYN